MYCKRNIQTHSRNNCCCGDTIIITHSECVFLAIVIQHAKRMGRIITLPVVWMYHTFPHYLTNGTISEKKNY